MTKCDGCAHSTTLLPKRTTSCNRLCLAATVATYLVVCLQVVQCKLQHLLLLGCHVKILQSLLENKTSTSAFVLTRAAGETQSNFWLFYSSVVLLFTAFFCASQFGNLYRSKKGVYGTLQLHAELVHSSCCQIYTKRKKKSWVNKSVFRRVYGFSNYHPKWC